MANLERHPLDPKQVMRQAGSSGQLKVLHLKSFNEISSSAGSYGGRNQSDHPMEILRQDGEKVTRHREPCDF
jgi:hypothetical protein